MNKVSNLQRVVIRGGPHDGMMVDCPDNQDEIRLSFATSNLLPLMTAGLPITNSVVVAVVAVYWDVASERERKVRPVRKFDFVELQDP